MGKLNRWKKLIYILLLSSILAGTILFVDYTIKRKSRALSELTAKSDSFIVDLPPTYFIVSSPCFTDLDSIISFTFKDSIYVAYSGKLSKAAEKFVKETGISYSSYVDSLEFEIRKLKLLLNEKNVARPL